MRNLGVLIIAATFVGCAGGRVADTGDRPANAYVSADIEASHAAAAGDLRNLRAFEPGHPGFSYAAGTPAPADFWRR